MEEKSKEIKDATERRIGNTSASDFEFYQQLKEGQRVKEKLDNAAYADSPLDAIDAVAKASESTKEDDPVTDYIRSKTPKADYTDSYDELVKQETSQEIVKEEFDENNKDITEQATEAETQDKGTVDETDDSDDNYGM